MQTMRPRICHRPAEGQIQAAIKRIAGNVHAAGEMMTVSANLAQAQFLQNAEKVWPRFPIVQAHGQVEFLGQLQLGSKHRQLLLRIVPAILKIQADFADCEHPAAVFRRSQRLTQFRQGFFAPVFGEKWMNAQSAEYARLPGQITDYRPFHATRRIDENAANALMLAYRLKMSSRRSREPHPPNGHGHRPLPFTWFMFSLRKNHFLPSVPHSIRWRRENENHLSGGAKAARTRTEWTWWT